MSALRLVRELLYKVYHWHRVPSSVKAKAVLLYFRGMSLRDVQKYLSNEGYEVSIEAIREWFHSVGEMLKALLVYSARVYVDETTRGFPGTPSMRLFGAGWRLLLPFTLYWRLKVDMVLLSKLGNFISAVPSEGGNRGTEGSFP